MPLRPVVVTVVERVDAEPERRHLWLGERQLRKGVPVRLPILNIAIAAKAKIVRFRDFVRIEESVAHDCDCRLERAVPRPVHSTAGFGGETDRVSGLALLFIRAKWCRVIL